ncbi:NLP/P60 protein [Solidesulfovibrio carbinoliphilus subsp. oakridgensis]|uniref:NLP/P60 protein n=1 Tax=Solidesulfovibrio carbinoliphilus subsp. oakridgensis TaxID=694327 RepID=G7Q718_9BACT|nr:C40 family peptidase [Solidesulfovibrio carbinoliphilus]EHJ48501.1 NLP/P60 protein [Solidesulfovibrio carbinoliphilus subsp. oakridgensis]
MQTFFRLTLMLALGLFLGGCAFSGGGREPYSIAPGTGSVLDTARSQIGVPYRAAGQSPDRGFDCSGFVQWVYARHGVRLPRRTDDQLRTGRPVSKSELKTGDLVFFMPSSRSASLHVGIFDGHGGFIHSPSPGGRVREESILAPYWRTTYYAANRVLP